jgi:2',3'-cyclic-nucleotide 2'-phosphodiesterase (5'-nucleotidase family)
MAYDLQILHASDMEAGLAAVEDAPRFAAIVDAFDNTFANTLILSSGDNYLPGPFFNAGGDPALNAVLGAASIGRADIEILNRVGVEASAIGNHEFDAGTREMATAFFPAGAWQGGQFPYLSSNINFAAEPDLNGRLSAGGLEANSIKGRIAPTAIITEGGEKIGIIGLTTPEIVSISSPGPNLVVTPAGGQYDFAALAQVVNNSVLALQTQHPGLNKIVLVSHLQQFQNELNLAPLLKGVDIVIAGGSNTITADAGDRLRTGDASVAPAVRMSADPTPTPILIVSTDGNYRYVGRMVVSFDASGVLEQTSPGSGIYMNPANSGTYAADDQGVLDVSGAIDVPTALRLQPRRRKSSRAGCGGSHTAKDGNLFGQTSVYLEGRRAIIRTQETNLGNLTADANLFAARQITGDATIGISLKNGGGIRDSIGSAGEQGELLPTAANPSAGKQAGVSRSST